MTFPSHISDIIEDHHEQFNTVAIKTILSDSILALPSEEREDLLNEVQNLSTSNQILSGEFNFTGKTVLWSCQTQPDGSQEFYISLEY